jgi:hypothetical protein
VGAQASTEPDYSRGWLAGVREHLRGERQLEPRSTLRDSLTKSCGSMKGSRGGEAEAGAGDEVEGGVAASLLAENPEAWVLAGREARGVWVEAPGFGGMMTGRNREDTDGR